MQKLGFIGMGNMAIAIAAGIIDNRLMDARDIYAYAPHYDKLKTNAERIGFIAYQSLTDMVNECDTLIMACKPYQIETVLTQIRDALAGKTLLSVASGWDYDTYAQYVDATTRVQYIMPNTPAKVGEGVFLFEEKNSLMADEQQEVVQIFEALGQVVVLPTNLMKIGGVISGCGPAFIDLVIEALGDAGVKYGLPRAQAYQLASQMILGSAKLQMETEEHPGVLKDQVCSPAGTTIRGVGALERAGLRAAFLDAIDAIMIGS